MLQDFLDEEFAWRLKEVADFKISVKTSSLPLQRTVIRAGVPLLYAHWEGFVKNSSDGYLNFVNSQRLRYDQLANCFIVFGAMKQINDLIMSKATSLNIAAVDFFISRLADRAELNLSRAINTKSNLSSIVFKNIAISIGIDPNPYQARYNLIDVSLLRRRNKIAHGEYLDLGPDGYRTLADEIIILMRRYKTDVENSAALRKYLA